MTITSATNRNQSVANGVNTAFTYTFKIFDEDDIAVYIDGTLKTITTHYTVSGVGNPSGGTVTFLVAPTNLAVVTLVIDEPFTQEIDYVDGDDFPASSHEEGLDRSVSRDLLLKEQIDRAVKLSVTSTETDITIDDLTDEAGKYVIVNDTEDGFEYATIASTLTGVAIASGDSQRPIRVNATDDGFEVSSTLELAQINDSNGNELVKFTTTASAVNEVTVANAATGAGPTISATGSDANIPINIQPKGTGVCNVLGTSTSAAEVRVFEDTDNGTNYIGLKAPTAITASKTWVLPETDVTNGYFKSDGSGNISLATVGGLVQQVNTATGAVATGTTTIPDDDTIMQNTEGDEYMTLSVTPTNASNILIIESQGHFANSGGGVAFTMGLFQDSTANALATTRMYHPAAGALVPNFIEYRMVAGTTSATTFKIRAGSDGAGTTTFNGVGGARKQGGSLNSFIRITEITA